MQKGRIVIPGGVAPWPHEMRVARILASLGYIVEFIPKGSIKTADILLNGVEFEIKSPLSNKSNSLEHVLKKALRQSPNIIFDTSRIQEVNDIKIKNFLARQAQQRKQIKRIRLIMKSGEVVDIK